MEKDYNSKLKYSKEKIDEQIKEACRGILKEKDDEISKLQIKVCDLDISLKIRLISPFLVTERHG